MPLTTAATDPSRRMGISGLLRYASRRSGTGGDRSVASRDVFSPSMGTSEIGTPVGKPNETERERRLLLFPTPEDPLLMDRCIDVVLLYLLNDPDVLSCLVLSIPASSDSWLTSCSLISCEYGPSGSFSSSV